MPTSTMDLPPFVQEIIRASFFRLHSHIMDPPRRKHHFWQPWLESDETSKQGTAKQLPTTKWKRDRRQRPDYLRKSDPKLPEELLNNENGTATNNAESTNGTNSVNGVSSKTTNSDIPLDMSIRQRGLPPSYQQTINNPGYRSNYRPSIVPSPTNGFSSRSDMPSGMPQENIGISMCDPIIDEHFRRSLGKDYVAVFSNNNVSKDVQPIPRPVTPPKVTTANVMELMDSSGMSVDDHFAKALGDTWLKLNKKENELQSSASESQSVVSI